MYGYVQRPGSDAGVVSLSPGEKERARKCFLCGECGMGGWWVDGGFGYGGQSHFRPAQTRTGKQQNSTRLGGTIGPPKAVAIVTSRVYAHIALKSMRVKRLTAIGRRGRAWLMQDKGSVDRRMWFLTTLRRHPKEAP